MTMPLRSSDLAIVDAARTIASRHRLSAQALLNDAAKLQQVQLAAGVVVTLPLIKQILTQALASGVDWAEVTGRKGAAFLAQPHTTVAQAGNASFVHRPRAAAMVYFDARQEPSTAAREVMADGAFKAGKLTASTETFIAQTRQQLEQGQRAQNASPQPAAPFQGGTVLARRDAVLACAALKQPNQLAGHAAFFGKIPDAVARRDLQARTGARTDSNAEVVAKVLSADMHAALKAATPKDLADIVTQLTTGARGTSHHNQLQLAVRAMYTVDTLDPRAARPSFDEAIASALVDGTAAALLSDLMVLLRTGSASVAARAVRR